MTSIYSRHRERADPEGWTLVTGTASWGPLSYGPYLVQRDWERISDVVTPNYKARVAAGEVINSPCSYAHETTSETMGSATGVLDSDSNAWWNQSGPITSKETASCADQSGGQSEWDGFDYPTTETPDSLDRTAKLKAIANIDASAFAFGEDVGEIKETLKFLRNPVSSLVKVGRSFRSAYKNNYRRSLGRPGTGRSRSSDAARLASAHADAWLEYRFALMPLLRSAWDLTDAVMTTHSALPTRLSAHGYAVDESEEQDSHTTDTYGSRTWSFDRSGSLKRHHHASILYEVSNPAKDWKRHYGLRATDLPTTAWQLVPFSFMVDRVVDISSAVRGLSNLALPQLKIQAGSVTRRTTEITTLACVGKTTSGWTLSISGGTRTVGIHTMERSIWYPSVVDIVPEFKPRGLVDDAFKIADALALFTGLVKR